MWHSLWFSASSFARPATPASASFELREWQAATEEPPWKNGFAAVLAACGDRAKSSNKGCRS